MLETTAERKTVSALPKHLPPKKTVPMVLGYFAASVALIAGGIFSLDRWVIPSLENSGQLESYLWTDENHRLNHFTYLKNDARKNDPVWRSQYLPVAPDHPGKKRILAIGDSFVWGDGSNNVNDLWWRQLDTELKRRGYADVEVIAAGLNGASTHEELDWMPQLVAKYKPDMVVFGYVTNDPEEKNPEGKPYVKMLAKEIKDEDPVLAKLNSLLPNLTGQLRQLRKLAQQAKLSKESGSLEYADYELGILEGDNFKAYENTVHKLGDYLKEAQVPAFVMTLPAGFQNKTKENTAAPADYFENVRKYNETRFEKVKPLFASAGVKFVDSADAFTKAAAQDPLLKANHSALRLGINPGNGHPGPFSTHFYAVTAADTIEHDFASVLPEKTATVAAPIRINDAMPPYMNVSADGASAETFHFTYPPDVTDHTLFMPLRKKHVQLSLSQPAKISKIELSGKNLSSAQIFVSYFDDKLQYAPGTFVQLPQQKGSDIIWDLPSDKKVNAIKLRAGFNGNEQYLSLKLKPAL